jgi:MFS family permease
MALSRFVSDWFIHQLGMQTMYIISAILITSGMMLAVAMPTFLWAMIGFSLVGVGTASIVPMTFVLAGNSQKYSPGMAISIIATYAIVGMLVGPALIGYIAHAFHLRVSFIFLATSGLMIIPMSMLYFKVSKNR